MSKESPHLKDLSLDQGQIDEILGDLGPCRRFDRIALGFNNMSFYVDTNATQFVLRLTQATWVAEKVVCEVAALNFFASKTTIPVPQAVKWSSECTDTLPFRWILMDRMEGRPMHTAIERLSDEQLRPLIRQVVGFVKELQGLTFPRTGSLYDSSGTLGPRWEGRPPQFDSVQPYLEHALHSALSRSAADKRMDCLAPARERAEELLVEIQTATLELAACPIVAFHGDFSYRNMLVNEDATRVTALLDWEWAGAEPLFREWGNGSCHNENATCAELFREVAAQAGVVTPDTLAGSSRLIAVYEVAEQLFPWQVGCWDAARDEAVLAQAANDLHRLLSDLGL